MTATSRPPKEESIAGCTGTDAPPLVLLLGREAQILGGSAGRDDQCIAGVVGGVAVKPEGPFAEVDPVDVVVDDGGAELLNVVRHAQHQFRPLESVVVPRPIVNVGGGGELAADLDPVINTGVRFARDA